ncbi:MAG: hypothetical protein COT84_07830 [Chlamydiae bacterium CG10_big_fil_rev_8_21_14_0_10_35_9]|nr:MAG: hypothetical protein COT84_07830 [Chlamydiae bacterium CG10_big_fil_rev_8_21_14_0_10_35_9]
MTSAASSIITSVSSSVKGNPNFYSDKLEKATSGSEFNTVIHSSMLPKASIFIFAPFADAILTDEQKKILQVFFDGISKQVKNMHDDAYEDISLELKVSNKTITPITCLVVPYKDNGINLIQKLNAFMEEIGGQLLSNLSGIFLSNLPNSKQPHAIEIEPSNNVYVLHNLTEVTSNIRKV